MLITQQMRVCQKQVRSLILIPLLIAVGMLTACQSQSNTQEPVLHQLQGKTMGTTWSVQFHTPDVLADGLTHSAEPSGSLLDIQSALEAELLRINQLMSTWDPNSQLSAFNKARHAEPIELHSDTLKVIDTALRVSHLSKGRYDITLSPVIQLWGFGEKLASGVPTDEEISKAMELVGSAMLVRGENTVRKRHPLLSLDVSSLGKGFAVDQLGAVLESFNVLHYLVEIGGELKVKGVRSDTTPWRVGIEHPDGEVQAGLNLRNTHVASSGSYRNYREEDGRRVSHIIDGNTGKPIEHQLVAVTVLHESTMLADAWATALLVVGEREAKVLIDQLSLDAQLVIRVHDSFEVYRSDGFAEQVIDKK